MGDGLMTPHETSADKEDCCSEPDVWARWKYVGGTLEYGRAYCKNCDARWAYGLEEKVMKRKALEGAGKAGV